MQEFQYSLFGMGMDGNWIAPSGLVEKYRYNGKELVQNGLSMYDYGARWQNPSIARFSVIDPLTENHPSWTGFNYVLNNPASYIDPYGLEPYAASNYNFGGEKKKEQ